MKDKRSLHLKVQELCDCYATTDPLKEMSIVKDDEDQDEAGLKWLALTLETKLLRRFEASRIWKGRKQKALWHSVFTKAALR